MPKKIKLYGLIAFYLFMFFTAPCLKAQSVSARHERIRSAMDNSDFAAAISELQSLSTVDQTAFTLNNYDYLLARLSERTGNPAMATAGYQKVAARNSILSQYALWHLAELARATGDLTLEREKLRQLIATAPASLLRDGAVARLGESFFESQDYASAVQTLRPRASSNGNASAREALALIGQAYLRSGQKDAAREAFNNLITQLPNQSQPDDFALAGVRGLDLLDSGSEDALTKGAPQLAEGEHVRRAFIYNFNRDFSGARRHYQAIIERYSASASVPEATYMIGRGFYQEGNYAEALNYFQQVITKFPDSSNARDALSFSGTAYARLKRYDEAINAYKGVIERYGNGPNPERPYLNIIDTLRDAGGRDAEALNWAEQTRNKFRGQIGATLALFSEARIHLSQGAWGTAFADFNTLRSESNLGGANTNGGTSKAELDFMIAYTLEQAGKTDNAILAYLDIPDGRNEYYGSRATKHLLALAADEKTRSDVSAMLEKFRTMARAALSNKQYEDARRNAQNALRLTADGAVRSELIEIVRRAYSELPAYSNIPTGQMLLVGRQNVITGEQANSTPTHKAIADELLFLGLYDEGAPELAVAETAFGASTATSESKPPVEGATANDKASTPVAEKQTSTSPTLSRDAAYTLAVLFKRGDDANHAIRYAEPLWKKVPADYLMELAPRESVELLYPAPYRNALLEYAPQRNVDPRFVLSIMRQESRFRPEAKSNAAARGLLQFISSTANTIASQLDLKDFQQDDLYNPRIAVLFGSQYMGNLFKQFPDMPQAVAASYNGGEDNVARWVARAHSNDPDRYVPEIGFAQSKDYVTKVLPNYWTYQMLYNEQLQRR
jgi:soluble lytic murein transglycosylase